MKTATARYAVGVRRPAPTSSSASSPVKRWTLKIIQCLLAGAVVTWGVAWGCALWAPFEARCEFEDAHRMADTRLPFVEAAVGTKRSFSREACEGLGVSMIILLVSDITEGQQGSRIRVRETWYVLEAGWPSSALWSAAVVSHDPVPRASAVINGVEPRVWMRPAGGPGEGVAGFPFWRGYLPLGINPVGFAFNILVYAGLVLGVAEAIKFARRRGRRLKGLCPLCGYDRGGLAKGAACPECGT